MVDDWLVDARQKSQTRGGSGTTPSPQSSSRSSVHYTTAKTSRYPENKMSANTPQTINVSDLDLPQLADVRRQLEEVRKCQIPDLNKMLISETHRNSTT